MNFRDSLLQQSQNMGNGKEYEGEKFEGRVHGVLGFKITPEIAFNKFSNEYETQEKGLLFFRTSPGMDDPVNPQVVYNKALGDWMDNCEAKDPSLEETFMKFLVPPKDEIPGFMDACFVYWKSRKGKIAQFAGKEVEVQLVIKIPLSKPGYPIRSCFTELKSITNVFTAKTEEIASRRRSRKNRASQAAQKAPVVVLAKEAVMEQKEEEPPRKRKRGRPPVEQEENKKANTTIENPDSASHIKEPRDHSNDGSVDTESMFDM